MVGFLAIVKKAPGPQYGIVRLTRLGLSKFSADAPRWQKHHRLQTVKTTKQFVNKTLCLLLLLNFKHGIINRTANLVCF